MLSLLFVHGDRSSRAMRESRNCTKSLRYPRTAIRSSKLHTVDLKIDAFIRKNEKSKRNVNLHYVLACNATLSAIKEGSKIKKCMPTKVWLEVASRLAGRMKKKDSIARKCAPLFAYDVKAVKYNLIRPTWSTTASKLFTTAQITFLSIVGAAEQLELLSDWAFLRNLEPCLLCARKYMTTHSAVSMSTNLLTVRFPEVAAPRLSLAHLNPQHTWSQHVCILWTQTLLLRLVALSL